MIKTKEASTMHRALLLTGTILLSLANRADANVRRFTYTTESAVLPAGTKEFELWTTWRAGRADVYSRLENRVELEFGITDSLMTAVYINWKKVSERDPATGDLMTGAESTGVSSEWKYKVLDPTADPLGLAGYFEATGDSDEAELELKVILDKAVGPLVVSYNAIGEAEWHWVPNAFINDERIMEHVLGASIAPAAGCALGAEARARYVYIDGALEVAAAFAGPAFHYAHGGFWITATCLFQVKGLKTIPSGETLELNDHERVNARVLVSLPL